MRRSVLVSILLMATVGPALPQTRPDDASRAISGDADPDRLQRVDPAPRPGRTIEEIVVTAQKKAENIEDVPISITALTGDFLEETGITQFRDLVHFTPSVYFQENGPAGSAIFIRGFGTPFALSTLDPGVSLVLDELAIPRDIYLAEPLFDLERFEVLRGPQGTLFGKNTPAGLFNVTTRRPTRELTGSILASVGGRDTHRVEAAVGGPLGPLGDVAQFRLAILESDAIDAIVNTKTGEDEPNTEQRAGRISLALQPLDSLDVLFIGYRAMTDAPRNYAWQQQNLKESSVTFLRQYDPKFEDDPFDHQGSQNGVGGADRTTDLLQVNLRQQIPDFGPLRNLEAVAVLAKTGFDQLMVSDADISPVDIVLLPDATFIYDQHSVELRTSGTAPVGWGNLDFLFGGFLFDADFSSSASAIPGEDIGTYFTSAPAFELATGEESPGGVGFQDLQAAATAFGFTLPAGPSPFASDGFHISAAQRMESKALFGQLAWHPTEQWTASAGARANFEDKSAIISLECFTPGAVCAAAGGQSYTANPERSETDLSPKFTLQYFPFENLSLFAAYAQGYKSGGFNNLALTPDGIEVEPEKTRSWEAGAKGTLFADTLSYGLTFFNMDVDDLQLQNFISSTVVVVRNAASARSRGIELDFRWLTPWQPLSVRGSGALTDAVFKSYPNAPAPRGSDATEQDLSGERLPYSPQRQLTVTPELRFPIRIGDLVGLGAFDAVFTSAIDIFYISSLFLDGDLDPNVRQDDYVLLNGRIGVANSDETLALTTFVTNLADNDVLTFSTDSSFFPGGYMGSQELPRNFAVQASYRW